jgi:hypothetical protein
VSTNTILGASLNVGNGQITLPAGEYYIRARAPANKSGPNKCFMYNLTATDTLLTGTSSVSANSTSASQTDSNLSGVFMLTVSSVLELRHAFSAAFASQGLGIATGTGSLTEIYSEVEIWKLN